MHTTRNTENLDTPVTEVTDGPEWRTASYSGCGATCVEVARTTEGAFVRDSSNPEGGTLAFVRDEIRVALEGIKAGIYELPE